MNRLLYSALLLFVASVVLVSCNGDEKQKHPIVGTWKLASESATGCTDPLDNYTGTYTCTATDCISVTFKSNGKFTIKVIDDGDVDTEEGTYTIDGNRITFCYPDVPPDCEELIFAIDGATLTITEVSEFDGCTYTTVLIK